jgi:hypothetical protein
MVVRIIEETRMQMQRRDELIGTDIDFAAEDAYWKTNYATRPYVTTEYGYDDYAPAYRYGAEAYGQHSRRNWEEAEADLARGWTRPRPAPG